MASLGSEEEEQEETNDSGESIVSVAAISATRRDGRGRVADQTRRANGQEGECQRRQKRKKRETYLYGGEKIGVEGERSLARYIQRISSLPRSSNDLEGNFRFLELMELLQNDSDQH